MFKKGDKVTWVSQSQGFTKEKTGEVITVVEPGGYPTGYFPNGGPKGGPRKHESYIVKANGRTYWPIVKYLRPA